MTSRPHPDHHPLKLYTAAGAARLLGVAPADLLAAIEAGQLRCFRARADSSPQMTVAMLSEWVNSGGAESPVRAPVVPFPGAAL